MPKKPPVVALLTDFGIRDHYVGVMKGVLLSICPNLQIIDLSHEIASQNTGEGSYLLWAAYPSLPIGSICLVVIDPGVGTSRRILLVKTKRQVFIAPDNGVLDLVLWQEKPLDVIALDEGSRFVEKLIPQKRSTTFHGRDVFAPIAAHIACGRPIRQFGRQCTYKHVDSPFITGRNSTVTPKILHIDRFGNLVTNILLQHHAEERFVNGIVIGKRRVDRWIGAYEEGPPDTPCLIVGSSGLVEIVAYKREASSVLRASRESSLKLIP